MINKLNEKTLNEKSGVSKQISEFQDEMVRLLQNKTMSVYMQLYVRYLNM